MADSLDIPFELVTVAIFNIYDLLQYFLCGIAGLKEMLATNSSGDANKVMFDLKSVLQHRVSFLREGCLFCSPFPVSIF